MADEVQFDISSSTMTAVSSDFEEKTSKAGKKYFTGTFYHTPSNAQEPIEFRAFASSFAFRDVVPTGGDRVLVAGAWTAERDGSIGLRVSEVQVIGRGSVPVSNDEDDEELPF